jgi:hypothetical protein
VLPNPWDDREALLAFESAAWGVVQALYEQLAPRLNDLHGTAWPQGYWELLLGPWLLHHVSSLLDRRLRVLTAHRLAPDAVFAVGESLAPPTTSEQAYTRWVGDAGNLDLLSRLAEPLGPTRRTPTAPVPAPAPESGQGLGPRALGLALDRLAQRLLLGGRAGRDLVVLSTSHLRLADSLWLLPRVPTLRVGTRRPWPGGPAERPPERTVDRAARERLAGLVTEVGGVSVNPLVDELIPPSFVVGYPAVRERRERRYGPPAAAVIGNYTLRDEENEYLGRCLAAGRRLAFAQHGGSYRQSLRDAHERLELRPDGVFATWGWEGPGARVAASPHLARLRGRHRGGDRVLLVEVVLPRYVMRFNTWPQGEQADELPDDLLGLVRAVGDPVVRDRLVLKRVPVESSGVVRHPQVAALPFVDERRSPYATDWMRTSRLVVMSYPATTLIEALVMDVPMVAQWRLGHWENREDAREPFAALIEAGILFDDPVAAAARVDAVYAHADEWWQAPEVRAARSAFLRRFGRSDGWRRDWIALLRELRGT